MALTVFHSSVCWGSCILRQSRLTFYCGIPCLRLWDDLSLPASMKCSIYRSHREVALLSLNDQFRRRFPKWIKPWRVVLRPPQEFLWLFITTCQYNLGLTYLNTTPKVQARQTDVPRSLFLLHPPLISMKYYVSTNAEPGFVPST